MQFMADVNFSPKMVSILQQEGWDIVHVSQHLQASAPDEEILNLARQEGRVVITQDLDFSTLLALGGYESPSLITIRMSNTRTEIIARRLLDLHHRLEEILLEGGCAITVQDNALRIRRLPIQRR